MTTSASAKQPGNVYLALGDSLAEGSGATDPARVAYVPHLFGFFHGESHGAVDRLVNLGVGGETSETFVTHGQLEAALRTIRDSNVTIVTFDIGGNDFLNLLTSGSCAQDPTSPECYAEAVQVIQTFAQYYSYSISQISTALANKPGNPRMLVMTYYNPWSGTGQPITGMANLILMGRDGRVDCAANATDPSKVGINDIITCVGRQFGVTVADAYPRFVGKGPQLTHILENDIHPNNAGYAQIAAAFKEAYLGR